MSENRSLQRIWVASRQCTGKINVFRYQLLKRKTFCWNQRISIIDLLTSTLAVVDFGRQQAIGCKECYCCIVYLNAQLTNKIC